jgi:hypothetical protein
MKLKYHTSELNFNNAQKLKNKSAPELHFANTLIIVSCDGTFYLTFYLITRSFL